MSQEQPKFNLNDFEELDKLTRTCIYCLEGEPHPPEIGQCPRLTFALSLSESSRVLQGSASQNKGLVKTFVVYEKALQRTLRSI